MLSRKIIPVLVFFICYSQLSFAQPIILHQREFDAAFAIGDFTFESEETYVIDSTMQYDGDVPGAPDEFYGCYIWGNLIIEQDVIIRIVGVEGTEEWEDEENRPDELEAVIRVIGFEDETGTIDATDGAQRILFEGEHANDIWNGIRLEDGAGDVTLINCDFKMLIDPTNQWADGAQYYDELPSDNICIEVLDGGLELTGCTFEVHGSSIIQFDLAGEDLDIDNCTFIDYEFGEGTVAGVNQCINIIDGGDISITNCTIETDYIHDLHFDANFRVMESKGITIFNPVGDCDADVTVSGCTIETHGDPIYQAGTGDYFLILKESTINTDTQRIHLLDLPSIRIMTGTANIHNNWIGPGWMGIWVEAWSPGDWDADPEDLIQIHNNFIRDMNYYDFPAIPLEQIDADERLDSGTGIFCDTQDTDETTKNIRIYNNFIFDIEKNGIRLGEDGRADIIYNTIHDPGENCIRVINGGSQFEQIFNNVFSEWPTGGAGYAINYTGNFGGAAELISHNLYCDLDLDYWVENEEEDEGGNYTEGVDAHGGFDLGPHYVATQREANNRYNPWDDDYECDVNVRIYNSTVGNLDFHLFDGWIDGPTAYLGSIPSFTNQGFQRPVNEDWWYGNENDFRDNPGRPLDQQMQDDFVSNPDAGAYGGPWSDDWAGVPVDGAVISTVGWDDPYILVDQPNWQWDGDEPSHEYVKLTGDLDVGNGDNMDLVQGLFILMGNNVGVNLNGGVFTSVGTSSAPIAWACMEPGNTFDGLYVNSTMDPEDVTIDYNHIMWADYGVKLNGVTSTMGYRVDIDHTTIDSCGAGIYANNSRVEVSNSTITNSNGSGTYGAGIYLTSCSSGKVILDNNTITDNGTGSTYASAGVYLNSSDPEMIWNTIEDNSGAGVSCYGSKPDLDTWDAVAIDDRPNTIQTNGGVHSGSDGSEIYLASSSYPDVKYNNIVDYNLGPIGYMIYKNSTNNTGSLTATYNYWGATPTSSFFYWGSGSSIDYSNYSGTVITSAEEYAGAVRLWERGEYAEAARHFRNCITDTGAIGMNSIHYLAGCAGELEDGNFRALRGFLQDAAEEHEDDRVASVAARFATHCLTEQGLFEDAMAEYDDQRVNAECVQDSIAALIDYLAVEELANGGHIDAAGSGDIPSQISELMRLLDQRNEQDEANSLTPDAYMLNDAFPNPFNSTTTIGFNLKDEQHVSLRVFDLSGRLVETLINGRLEAGKFRAVWNADLQAAGVYFYRLQAGSFQQTKKLTLVK